MSSLPALTLLDWFIYQSSRHFLGRPWLIVLRIGLNKSFRILEPPCPRYINGPAQHGLRNTEGSGGIGSEFVTARGPDTLQMTSECSSAAEAAILWSVPVLRRLECVILALSSDCS